MKSKPNRFLATSLATVAALSSSAWAVDRFKQNNTDDLNLSTSWNTAPGTGDVAVWDSPVFGANTVNLGANLSWGGLRIADPGGDVIIGGGNLLTLGASGLDTGGTRNLTLTNTGASTAITASGTLAGSTTLTLDSNTTRNWTGMTAVNFTGTLVLRGGTGTSGNFSNNWLALGATTLSQTGSFHLDTGASLTNRGDFILTDGWGDGTTKPKLALASLTGFGDFRSDWGGTGNRTISVNSANNHEFQGRIVQNNNSTRSIHFENLGVGTQILSGENAYQNTIVGAGKLQIGNGGATGNIGFGTVSVASGATLEFNRTGLLDYNASARMRNVSGAGDIVVDGGVKLFNYTGSGTGFDDANSWNNFSGDLIIKGGSEFQTIRNGRTAMGTAQVILGDATTSGTLSQIQGSWTWTNNIQLVGSANQILNNSTGAPRSNKLQGVLSGDGNVTFSDSTGAMNDGNLGYILTGTNTLTGMLTVDTFVRVGGVTGDSVATTAGTGGTLGAADVVINSGKRLTFTRTDSHVVANTISGDGAVHIGTADLAETATQVVELSGTNTYAGATNVNLGRLNLTGSLTSAVSVLAAGKISGSGSTTGLLTTANGTGIVLAGGATTTGLTVNGATFGGDTTVTFDTDPVASTVYDVFTYGVGAVTDPVNLTVAWRGTLADDMVNDKYTFTAGAPGIRTWNTNDGFWAQGIDPNWAEGDNLFYGGDTVIFNDPALESFVTLEGVLVPVSVTVTNTNAYTFEGPGLLSGAMSLTKSGTGTLTISAANTYTGGTTLSGGTLALGNATALGTGAATVATGATLDVAGFSAANAINLSGTGNGTNPALWNSATTFTSLAGLITLNADATVGHATTDAGNSLVLGSLNLNSNKLSITAGSVFLTIQNIPSGNIDINNGGTLYSQNGGSLTSATGTITINSGGRFETRDTNNTAMTSVHDIVLNGGTLSRAVITNNNGGGAGTTLKNNISVDATNGGTITNNVGGFAQNFRLTGTLAGSGDLTLNGTQGVDFRGDTTGYTGTLNATAGNLIFSPAADTSFGGAITGTRPLTKQGANALALTTANSYTGGTELQGGTLRVNGLSSIGTEYLAVKNGATFDYRGTGSESTTRSLFFNLGAANIHIHESTAALTWNPGAGTRNQAFTKTGPGALTIGGAAFSGAASVTLNAGSLSLTGTSTYTGATAVNLGVLTVSGALGNTGVTVENGGTLAGNGNLGGSVTIEAGGTHALAVAATPGAQVTRTITGALDLSAVGDILTLTAASPPAAGTYILATATGGITDTPETVNQIGVSGTFAINGNNLELTVTGNDYDDWADSFSLVGGPSDDDDGDGLTNFEEYAFGLDPTSGASVSPITAPDKAAGTFTYSRRTQSLTGLEYTYESSTTLAGTWPTFTPAVADVSDNGNPVEIITVTIPAALLAETKLFLRVKAVEPVE